MDKLNLHVGNDTYKIILSYLVVSDSIHFDGRPLEPPSRITQGGHTKYWYTLPDNKLYYAEMQIRIKDKDKENTQIKRVWYNMSNAEPQASKCDNEPVCWLDSGKLDTPHRIGAPAWGEDYYIGGYRFPPEVGRIFKPNCWYNILIRDRSIFFGKDNDCALMLKYENGQIIVNEGSRDTIGASWGFNTPFKTLALFKSIKGRNERQHLNWGYAL